MPNPSERYYVEGCARFGVLPPFCERLWTQLRTHIPFSCEAALVVKLNYFGMGKKVFTVYWFLETLTTTMRADLYCS